VSASVAQRRNRGLAPGPAGSTPLLDVSGFDRRVVLSAGEASEP
jgi:hypothetical protein